jgi:endonuclease III
VTNHAVQHNLTLMKKENIEKLFAVLSADNPEPKTELTYSSTFTLLVAVVLSAQATDIGVNKATPALFKAADTPAKMAALGEAKIRDLVKTIGLYRTKAKNVARLSEILFAEHDSIVPNNREDLEALPGVGRKTANVVLNEAFGEPTIAVDTHIFRVSNRTGLAKGKTPVEVEKKLLKAVPDQWKRYAHHWLLLHGRYICKARKPDCQVCGVADLCSFKGKA